MGSIISLSNIRFMFDMFRSAFEGVEWFLLAYVICLVWFFVIGREYLNVGFLYPFVFMLLTIFNPFFIVPLAAKIGLTARIRRLFWLLPVNLILAYAFTTLCFLRKKRWVRSLIAAGCLLFIVCCGTSVVPYLRMPENIYKTSNTVLEISRIIEEDSAATGTDKAALYSSQQLLELRQYNPAIRSLLRRNDLLDWELESTDDASVQAVIDSGHHLHTLALVSRYGIRIDKEDFLRSAKKCNANYIITHYDMELGDYFEDAGYELIGEAGDFEIYRVVL